MTRRRITSVVMVLALVCSLMVVYTPGIANAKEPAEEENIYKEELLQTQYTYGDWTYEVYTEDHSKCFITKYNGTDTNVVIPSMIEGKTVVLLKANAFQDNKTIQSVYIPDTVRYLTNNTYDGRTFEGCTALTSVRFPEGLKYIPIECFKNCTSLTTIVIPDSVEGIGREAFLGCRSLRDITLGSNVSSIGSMCFSYCDSLVSITLPKSLFTKDSNANGILGHAYNESTALKNVTIEPGGDVIPSGLFSGCYSLTNIVIPEGIKYIYSGAFQDCTSLRNITLPNSIEYIGDGAFYNCKNLNTIKLGQNVKKICSDNYSPTSPFTYMSNLKDFYNYSMDTKYNAKGLFDDAGLVTLHGLKGSTTEAYAAQYNIPFVPLPDTAMLRMYNPYSGEHLYTSDQNEKEYLQISGWNYEGLAWIESSKAKTPVYRFYNPLSGEHHYTMDEGEKDYLAGIGWNYEGVGWKSSDDGTPVYRLFNPNNPGPAAHHYTTDKHEKEVLVSNGWNDEGIGWYGL